MYQTHPWIGGVEPAGSSPVRAKATPERAVLLPASEGGYQAEAKATSRRRQSRGPYSIFIYGGIASREVFSHYWEFNTADTQLLALGASARLYRFSSGLEIEGELGLARRFGDDELWEGWISAGLRWSEFPWNHVIDTTVGIQVLGLNYTSEVPPHKNEYFDNEKARLLNFFSPEVTLALPKYPDLALLLRLHHRSKLFGLYNEGGATFYTLGLRLQI